MSDTPTSGGKLAAAVIQVMRAVPYLQKKRTQGLNYSFASEADLIDKLHPAMIEAGLCILPVGAVPADNSTFNTAKGSAMRHVLAQCRYKLLHVSGEYEILETLGEANDSGDKAANKCMTGGYKYALRQAFNIETGDDPDEHPSSEQAMAAPKASQPAAPPQQQTATAPQQTGNGTAPPKEMTGEEFHRRIRQADQDLANKGQCPLGSLLAHITQAGLKAGYGPNLDEWTRPAIELAAAETRAFKAKLGKPATAA